MTLPQALYSAAQVRELDRRAIEQHGIAAYELMRRAGAAALAELQKQWPHAKRLVTLCGPGNNGGDGYVLARLAAAEGLRVTVAAVGPEPRPDSIAAQARADYGGKIAAFEPALIDAADVVADALLGIGLTRPVSDDFGKVIHAVNAAAKPVLALDIPSGLEADSGTVMGDAVRATASVCFIGLKQGMFTADGPDHCGETRFSDLDVPPAVYAGLVPSALRLAPEMLEQILPSRPRSAHKGRHGHVLVVGGDRGMAGAVRLAGEAALRVGAGLVTVATRPEHVPVIGKERPELMAVGVESPAELLPLLSRASVVALGPGLGQRGWGRGLYGAVLATDLPVVLDADGLNLLAAEPQARGNWILTPHPGEAARLLGVTTNDIQANRFNTLRRLATRYAGVAVLKGAGSLIDDATQAPLSLCDRGNPGMATAGMGDVLTGVIAGLLAQSLGLRPAAEAGVLLHAMAGDAAAGAHPRGLIAGDLMPYLRSMANP